VTEVKLVAASRSEFGKGAARRIRRADQIPAVLYGHGAAPLHISLPGHQTMLALKHSNALLTIAIDGADHLAIVKDIQRDVVRNVIEHVDLLTVVKGEKVAVVIPVRVVGESAPGTIHLLETQSVHIEVEATNIPESIEVSVEGLEAGATVRASELVIPDGAIYLGEPEDIIVAVSVPQTAEEPEEAAVEAVESVPAPQED
jgi:large subunit ribosomal protein L25